MGSERILNRVDLILHAKNNGKSDVTPCGDCKMEPATCGNIIIRPREGLDCNLYQQPIVLDGRKPEPDVMIEGKVDQT